MSLNQTADSRWHSRTPQINTSCVRSLKGEATGNEALTGRCTPRSHSVSFPEARVRASPVASHLRSALSGRFVTLRGFLLRRRSSWPQVLQMVEFGERESQKPWLAGAGRRLLLLSGWIRFPVAGAVAAGRSTRTSLCPQLWRIGLQHLTLPVAVASDHRTSCPRGPVVTSRFGNDHFGSFGSWVRSRRSGGLEQLRI